MAAWKQFERDSAALFNGKRFPANMGERIDFQGQVGGHPVWGQCKLVQNLSFQALTKLVEEMHEYATAGTYGVGVVCAKVRLGTGNKSEPIVAMSFEMLRRLMLHCRGHAYDLGTLAAAVEDGGQFG